MGSSQPQKPVVTLPHFAVGITAVALAPQHVAAAAAAEDAGGGGCPSVATCVHVLAVGLEDGRVQVWQLSLMPLAGGAAAQDAEQQVQEWRSEQLWVSAPWEQHAGAVKRLCWGAACVIGVCGGSPGAGRGQGMQLASCGEDHSVRVYEMHL